MRHLNWKAMTFAWMVIAILNNIQLGDTLGLVIVSITAGGLGTNLVIDFYEGRGTTP